MRKKNRLKRQKIALKNMEEQISRGQGLRSKSSWAAKWKEYQVLKKRVEGHNIAAL